MRRPRHGGEVDHAAATHAVATEHGHPVTDGEFEDPGGGGAEVEVLVEVIGIQPRSAFEERPRSLKARLSRAEPMPPLAMMTPQPPESGPLPSKRDRSMATRTAVPALEPWSPFTLEFLTVVSVTKTWAAGEWTSMPICQPSMTQLSM